MNTSDNMNKVGNINNTDIDNTDIVDNTTVVDNTNVVDNTGVVDDVVGLDDHDKDYIYLYHELDKQNKVSIGFGDSFLCKENPISSFISTMIECDSTIKNNTDGIPIASQKKQYSHIKNVTDEEELEVFRFIIRYLNVYSDKPEWSGLKRPATETNVKCWLEMPTESELFGCFRDINRITDVSKAQVRKVSLILLNSNYLGMNGLMHKCCYLIAYAIAGKSPLQIQKIMDV